MATNENNDLINLNNENNHKFIITKKIAKHGSQAIIVIPRAIEHKLKPGTLAKISIDVLEENIDKIDRNREKNNGTN